MNNLFSIEFLLSSGSTDEIKRWIEHLPTMHGDTVTVIKNTESESCFAEYTIEVDAARGRLLGVRSMDN